MNAKEAREKSKSIESGKNNTQYAEVLKSINKAIELGEFKAFFYKPLTTGVRSQLKTDGYSVSEYDDQREGTTITITW